MIISNKTYDILKWVLITVIPALILLITTLGTIYNFEDISNIICLTISAIATFISSILGISSSNYKKGK